MPFWALKVEPDVTYSQIVNEDFNVTMASLGTDAKIGDRTSLVVRYQKADYVLCTLTAGTTDQQRLNLSFGEGEEVTFMTAGPNTIDVTGFLIPPADLPEPFEDMDELDDDEIDEIIRARAMRARNGGDEDEEDSEDDSEDEDYVMGEGEEDFEDDESDYDSDEDSDEAAVEEGEDGTVTLVTPAAKSLKRAAEKAADAPVAKKAKKEEPVTPKKETPKKKEKETPKPAKKEVDTPKSAKKEVSTPKSKETSTPKSAKKETPKKAEPLPQRELHNGVKVQDLSIGAGKKAKPGKRCQMYYRGKLQNGKVFDQCLKGTPFDFRLGSGEVIKAWDIGVAGMQVGGRRRIIAPPKTAYGNQKLPGIPPNSTLIFDVELRNVA